MLGSAKSTIWPVEKQPKQTEAYFNSKNMYQVDQEEIIALHWATITQ